MGSSTPLQDDPPPDVSLEEIIFSCDVCQATVSEVYATKEQHDGFHSGSSQDRNNGIVAKFWIGECSHVFCGRHLEGGGVAFHSKDVAPTAGCPVCPKDLPSSRAQEIFAIRGLNPGEYDDIIPESWLRCPPTRLDTRDAEMDALRFQYQRLASYAKKVNKTWKIAESKRYILEATLSKERKQWRKREAETKEAIRKRDGLIEDRDAKLEKWNGRKEIINHYMSIVGPMAKDIADMRTLLVELGYRVPIRDYSYRPKPKTEPMQIDEPTQQHDRYGSSATTLVDSNIRTSSALRKRKANIDAYADSQEQRSEEPRARLNHDRAMMMPPPLPKTRPPRPPDQSARHEMSQRDGLQRRDSYLQSGVQPRQQHADTPTQQSPISRQQSGKHLQQRIPPTRELASMDTRRTFPGSHQDLANSGHDQRPSTHSSMKKYGSRGLQGQAMEFASNSTPSGMQALSPTQQPQLPLAPQNISYRGVPSAANNVRNDHPAREPLAYSTLRSRVETPFSEAGDWRGGTPRAPFDGESVHRSSQFLSIPSQRIEGPHTDAPLYRQSRRPHAGHNGTTTLSSEFRGQEITSTAPRRTGLLAQPPKRSQRAPFSTAGSNAYLQSQPDAPSDVDCHDTVYSPLAQQRGQDAPTEIEGFRMLPPPARTAARLPFNDGGQHRLSTPTCRKHLGPTAASSVVSPFFGQPTRRQPEAIRREHRQQFSYVPPQPSSRGVPSGHHQRDQRDIEMLPPTSAFARPDRNVPSRVGSFVPPGAGNIASSLPSYARGSQPASSVIGSREPHPAVPRDRITLPSVPVPSYRNVRGGVGAARQSAYEPRSLFSGAGPSRRVVRR